MLTIRRKEQLESECSGQRATALSPPITEWRAPTQQFMCVMTQTYAGIRFRRYFPTTKRLNILLVHQAITFYLLNQEKQAAASTSYPNRDLGTGLLAYGLIVLRLF